MQNNFEEYNGRKDRLICLLEEARDFYDKIGEEKTARTIKDHIEVIRSGEFEVVVVGEFSAGKSTFLNALMREKYLPSYTRETTATINYLRNRSESERPGIVYYMDGHTEELEKIDSEIVEKYVSTKSDKMDVSKSVRHFDLYLESPFLENKVTLIDSPGLNGIREGLGEITDAQIRRSHAIIFMFSAEQPGKRSDFEYLKKIKDEVSTVFLVLNKIDCIGGNQNQTVEGTVKNLIGRYKEIFPEDTCLPEVIPVSAYKALVARSKKNLDYRNQFHLTREEKEVLESESRMGIFEEKLLRFLTNGEKTVMQIKEPLTRLTANLEKSVEKFGDERDVAQNKRSALELDDKIAAAENAIQALEGEIGSNRSSIRQAVRTVEREILEYMDGEIENVRRRLNAKVDGLSSVDALDEELTVLNQCFERSIRTLAQNLDERFRELFFDQVQDQYVSIVDRFEERLENVEIHGLHFDAHIFVTAKDIQSGLDRFTEETKKLEMQIDRLEQEKKRAGLKEDKFIEMSAKADYLTKRYERIRQSQSELQSTFCPPEIVYTPRTKVKVIERQGIAKIWDLFGNKTIEYPYNEKDDSERRAYIQDFRADQAELAAWQEKLEEQLEAYSGIDRKLERVERERADIQAELQRLRQKEADMKREFNTEVDKKYEKEVKRVRSKMKEQIEELLEKTKPLMKQSLKENRKKFTAVLQDLIEQSIASQLETKKQEAEDLKRTRQSANENTEAALNAIRAKEKCAAELLEKSRKLLDEVNGIEVEKREYQTI